MNRLSKIARQGRQLSEATKTDSQTAKVDVAGNLGLSVTILQGGSGQYRGITIRPSVFWSNGDGMVHQIPKGEVAGHDEKAVDDMIKLKAVPAAAKLLEKVAGQLERELSAMMAAIESEVLAELKKLP